MSAKPPTPNPLMPDPYETFPTQLDSPAVHFYTITPNDGARLPTRPRAIRVGVAGDVNAVAPDGTVVLLKNCYAGEILDIRAIQIRKSGTTADNLVALV